MTQLKFEGLFNENERSDHVYQCTHPVFATYAMSTYTYDQASRMMHKLPITCVQPVEDSGVCVFGDGSTEEVPHPNFPDKAACEATVDPLTGEPMNKYVPHFTSGISSFYLITEPIISNKDDLVAGQSPASNQYPCDAYNLTFARFDTLKKEYIQISTTQDWDERYPQALNEIYELSAGNEALSNPDGGNSPTQFTGYLGNGIIKLNRAANEGKYAFLANDPDNVKRTKLNVQLLLNEIQSSLSGVLNFQANLSFTLHPECITFSSGVPFSLHLYDSNVETRSNKRAVVQRGKPRFAMQPNLAFGVAYAGAIPTGGTPGVYTPPEAGGDNNPNNMVGGELDITYDPNTKMFEAGTKAILARLLTDINRVSLNNINIDNVDTIPPDQLSPNGDHYMGNFSTGWAVPLQMHNNNPYEYGPVFKNYECGNLDKHKIRVVNRAPKTFPKGQIVMCHKINGEWIIMDFGPAEQVSKSFEFGKWQFWKLIANKDSYRRDDRYHYDPNVVDYHESILNDATYEGLFRAKFYQDLDDIVKANPTISEVVAGNITNPIRQSRPAIDEVNAAVTGGGKGSLAKSNGGWQDKTITFGGQTQTFPQKVDINFVGSRRYQQTTSFDQMGAKAGGLNVHECIGLANPFRDVDGGTVENVADDNYTHHKLFPHWGPILTDGYTLDTINKLGTTDQGNGTILGYRSGGVGCANLFLPDTASKLGDIKTDSNWRLDNNILRQSDGLGIHLPADVGLNAAPYAENGSPIEDLQELLRCVNLDSQPSNSAQIALGGLLVGSQKDGNGADYMDNSAPVNLALGVREYLGDIHDLYYPCDNAFGANKPPFPRWGSDFTGASFSDVQIARDGQTSWRKGERPSQSRWVYLAKDDNAAPTGVDAESAYNLKPSNPNRICFIPLSAEHCGSLDFRSYYSTFSPGYNGDDTYARFLDLGSQSTSLYQSALDAMGAGSATLPAFAIDPNGAGVQIFPEKFARRSAENYVYLYGSNNPAKRIAYANLDANNGDGHGDHPGQMELNHLSWGRNGNLVALPDGDLVVSQDDTNSDQNGHGINGIRYGIPYGIYCRHQHEYGENGQGYAPNDLWSFGNDGLSTIGISSAKCTVKVRGYELAVKSITSAGITTTVPDRRQRWGTSGDGQMDFGTTAGYVKVYDAWPEEQTIFDPRYFAVMHFNPGTLLTLPGGSFKGKTDQDTAADVETKAYDDMYRWADNEEFDCDHRVPTISGAPGETHLVEVPVGHLILSDYPAKRQANTFYPSLPHSMGMIRPKSEWKVVTTRRGMLLPFKYRKKVLSLSIHDQGHNVRTYDSTTMTNNLELGDGTISAEMPSVWIASSGMGYKVGDTFAMQGGNPDVVGSTVVTQVNEDKDVGPVGAILELRPGNHPTTPTNGSFGENYDPSAFVSSEDYFKILKMDPNHPVSKAPQIQGVPSISPAGNANAGVGAVVYALHGICTTVDKLDVGPLKQQSAVRFTAASDGKRGQSSIRPFARKLSIPKPNTDYAYDLFMQYHNDVSHVFMHSDQILDHKAQFTQVEIIGV
tara:strand:- start:3 stop:4604 length:4602 start_codon:yes stop_codon:yes gene_type:complete